MSEKSERLLHFISARGSFPWNAFKKAFDQLDLSHSDSDQTGISSHTRRGRVMRVFDALAHCDFEFSDNNSRVCVAPPVLVRLPQAGLPCTVLAGARSPETWRDVEVSCAEHGCRFAVRYHGSGYLLVPARLSIESDNEDALHAVARSLGIHYDSRPAAWVIACFTASLDEYLAGASWRSDGDLNWLRKEFDTDCLQFDAARSDGNATRLIRYTNPKRGTILHLLRRGREFAAVDCDWGRYAALHDAGLNVLVYDERKLLLAVPSGAPLPRLFARAFGLCSGYPPISISAEEAGWPSLERRGFDVFRSVPSAIGEMVADKLGQSLLPRPINVSIH